MAVEKVTDDAPVVGEKGVVRDADERAPVGKDTFTATGEEYEQEDWMTRTGLNAKSFTRKHYGLGLVELDRKMKPRHLQMVAIGGSIGAGFFVGSGSALSKGVSEPKTCQEMVLTIPGPCYLVHRLLPRWSHGFQRCLRHG